MAHFDSNNDSPVVSSTINNDQLDINNFAEQLRFTNEDFDLDEIMYGRARKDSFGLFVDCFDNSGFFQHFFATDLDKEVEENRKRKRDGWSESSANKKLPPGESGYILNADDIKLCSTNNVSNQHKVENVERKMIEESAIDGDSPEDDDVDLLCKRVALTIKKLPKTAIQEAKEKLFNMVNELAEAYSVTTLHKETSPLNLSFK